MIEKNKRKVSLNIKMIEKNKRQVIKGYELILFLYKRKRYKISEFAKVLLFAQEW